MRRGRKYRLGRLTVRNLVRKLQKTESWFERCAKHKFVQKNLKARIVLLGNKVEMIRQGRT
jgi:hypothetical protein